MVKKLILVTAIPFLALVIVSGGLKPGDPAAPFSLQSVGDTIVSLSDYNNQKGLILVFTSNLCPFAKAYEQRIIQLHNEYAKLGFPVVAINSNSPEVSPDDSIGQMKVLADERNYPFPYLKDDKEEVCKAYGATRNPHVFLLQKSSNGFKIAYMGAIDDNSLDARSVSKNYLENAVVALLMGSKPAPATTIPIGCKIKTKN
jgi:peroxiredoxin